MIENIMHTGLLFTGLAGLLRAISGEAEAPFWWKAFVLGLGFVSLCVTVVTWLMIIWADA